MCIEINFETNIVVSSLTSTFDVATLSFQRRELTNFEYKIHAYNFFAEIIDVSP
jgi:hypothetical protein